MLLTELQNKIVAVLFAAGEPVEAARLEEALELAPEEMAKHLEDLATLFDEGEFPLQLRRMENSYQLCSRAVYGELVRRTLELGRNTPLSSAALEALAIVAYNQPVTRSFVEQIRGVDTSSVMSSLAEKGLIEEAGRLDLPGRPIAYRTTTVFLRCFGLVDLGDLPPVDPRGPELPPAEEDEAQLDFSSLSAEGDAQESCGSGEEARSPDTEPAPSEALTP